MEGGILSFFSTIIPLIVGFFTLKGIFESRIKKLIELQFENYKKEIVEDIVPEEVQKFFDTKITKHCNNLHSDVIKRIKEDFQKSIDDYLLKIDSNINSIIKSLVEMKSLVSRLAASVGTSSNMNIELSSSVDLIKKELDLIHDKMKELDEGRKNIIKDFDFIKDLIRSRQ